MKNKQPLVSVIIPTYKRASMLTNTIDSVINQDYKNIEVIVVDDNDPSSNDRCETEKIMEKYKHNRKVNYIKHDKNLKGCAARNTGMKNSHGDYICFLDDDDIIYHNKISKQVEFLSNNPSYGAVYCARKVGTYIHSPRLEGDLSYYLLSGESIVITIMLMFRNSSIKNIEWNMNLRRNQEAGFLLDFFNVGNKIGCIKEVLCETRLDDRSNVLDPFKNEKEMLNYLNEYDNIIKKMEKDDINIRKKIYSHRYVGILLSYLKSGKIGKTLFTYFRGCSISLFLFNKFLLKYTYMKIKHKKRDYYSLGSDIV